MTNESLIGLLAKAILLHGLSYSNKHPSLKFCSTLTSTKLNGDVPFINYVHTVR